MPASGVTLGQPFLQPLSTLTCKVVFHKSVEKLVQFEDFLIG
jgi:hypothetical protein